MNYHKSLQLFEDFSSRSPTRHLQGRLGRTLRFLSGAGWEDKQLSLLKLYPDLYPHLAFEREGLICREKSSKNSHLGELVETHCSWGRETCGNFYFYFYFTWGRSRNMCYIQGGAGTLVKTRPSDPGSQCLARAEA